jgi:hypothetical protein
MRHEEEEKNSCGWEEGEGGVSSTAKLLAQAVNIFTQQVKALICGSGSEHVFVNVYGTQESIRSMAGRYDK